MGNKYYISLDFTCEDQKLLPVEGTVFRAQLILTFQGHPVIVKPEGYFIKSFYQKKADKVVKGGEKYLKVKLLTNKVKQ